MQYPAPDAKRVKFTPAIVNRATCLRFKRRSGLLTFAQKYPGGLAAHFLSQVKMRMNAGIPSDSTEIREVDFTSWANNPALTELKDTRDQKELLFLGRILSEIGMKRIPQVADLIAMRVREMRAAKRDGGSWDKAAAISLMPGTMASNAALPDSAFSL